jgi:hypothetical protein
MKHLTPKLTPGQLSELYGACALTGNVFGTLATLIFTKTHHFSAMFQ